MLLISRIDRNKPNQDRYDLIRFIALAQSFVKLVFFIVGWYRLSVLFIYLSVIAVNCLAVYIFVIFFFSLVYVRLEFWVKMTRSVKINQSLCSCRQQFSQFLIIKLTNKRIQTKIVHSRILILIKRAYVTGHFVGQVCQSKHSWGK